MCIWAVMELSVLGQILHAVCLACVVLCKHLLLLKNTQLMCMLTFVGIVLV